MAEWLETYGWVILTILAVIGALLYFGVIGGAGEDDPPPGVLEEYEEYVPKEIDQIDVERSEDNFAAPAEIQQSQNDATYNNTLYQPLEYINFTLSHFVKPIFILIVLGFVMGIIVKLFTGQE